MNNIEVFSEPLLEFAHGQKLTDPHNGLALFGPCDLNDAGKPLSTCLYEVDQCDIFVGVIALRLGSIDEKSGKSYTQLEYERAIEKGKEILIYILDEKNSKVAVENIDFGEKHEKLELFKSRLRLNHTVDSFKDEIDLSDKLKRRFGELLSAKKLDNTKLDEYSFSTDLINKFYLMPLNYSGIEVKVKIKVKGTPFPASRQLCKAFGFEYGKTIGVRISILNPNLKGKDLEELFIQHTQAEDFLIAIKDDEKDIEVYARVLFADMVIERSKANFITKTYTNFEYNPMDDITTTIPAEATIILALTRMAKLV